MDAFHSEENPGSKSKSTDITASLLQNLDLLFVFSLRVKLTDKYEAMCVRQSGDDGSGRREISGAKGPGKGA